MKKGTTPTHEFSIPLSASMISKVVIVYAQKDIEVLRKETADCVLNGTTISCKLTEAETFLFDEREFVQIQIRIKTTSGNVLASDIVQVTADTCLDKKVMS